MSETEADDVFNRAFDEKRETGKDKGEVREADALSKDEPAAQEPQKEAAFDAPKEQPAKAKEPEKPKVDPEQFKGYLDEREKRQAAERKYEELRKRLEQQQPKDPEPDILDDPEGFKRRIKSDYETMMMRQKMQQSEFFAARDYGHDLVKEVKLWAAELDPATADRLASQASPFHAAVEEYKREQALKMLSEYDYDVEKMKAKFLEDMKAQQPLSQGAPASPAQTQNLPPKVAGEGGGVGSDPATISKGERFNRFFST